jgi:hypothetical protein
MTIDIIASNRAIFMRPLRLAPSAWTGHVPFAAWLTAAIQPRVIVELGSHYGVSYAAFCQAAQLEGLATRCYAVDSWLGDSHSGLYGEDVYQSLHAFNEKHFASFSSLLRTSFDEATTHFPDASIDLLHIDGLHTYEAVKHDFETWLPKLSDRATVLFHDTNVRERDFGVWRYWAELSAAYPHFEFDHSAGLGVLQVGRKVPHELQPLLALPPDSVGARDLKEMFSGLGDAVFRTFELRCATDEVARLRHELSSLSESAATNFRKAEIEGYKAQFKLACDLRGKSQAIAIKDQIIAMKDQNIAMNEQNLAAKEAVIAALHGSRSMRITKPLRAIQRQKMRVQRAISLVGPAIKFGGGFLAAVRKAFRLYQAHGFEGIKRGFRAAAESQKQLDQNK